MSGDNEHIQVSFFFSLSKHLALTPIGEDVSDLNLYEYLLQVVGEYLDRH